jgi:hypothetical protein
MLHSGALGGEVRHANPANLRPSPLRAPRWHKTLVVAVLLAAAACADVADTPSTRDRPSRHLRPPAPGSPCPPSTAAGSPRSSPSRRRVRDRGRRGPLGAGRLRHGGPDRPGDQRGRRRATARPCAGCKRGRRDRLQPVRGCERNVWPPRTRPRRSINRAKRTTQRGRSIPLRRLYGEPLATAAQPRVSHQPAAAFADTRPGWSNHDYPHLPKA